MSIYTRTGDTGTTSLFGGKRVLKCEELVDAYGSIDELNSWIGLITADDKISPEQKEFLQKIQSDLFIIGGSLAGWREIPQGPALGGIKGRALDNLDKRVMEMEVTIDVLEKNLPPLKNFIIPGGTTSGARVHLARSVSRRVERQVVALKAVPDGRQVRNVREVRKVREEDYNLIIKYLNRLSDLLFILARTINKKSNVTETIWSGIIKDNINKKK